MSKPWCVVCCVVEDRLLWASEVLTRRVSVKPAIPIPAVGRHCVFFLPRLVLSSLRSAEHGIHGSCLPTSEWIDNFIVCRQQTLQFRFQCGRLRAVRRFGQRLSGAAVQLTFSTRFCMAEVCLALRNCSDGVSHDCHAVPGGQALADRALPGQFGLEPKLKRGLSASERAGRFSERNEFGASLSRDCRMHPIRVN